MRIFSLKGSWNISNIDQVYDILKTKKYHTIDYSEAEIDEYAKIVFDCYNANTKISYSEKNMFFSYNEPLQYLISFFSFSKILFMKCQKDFQRRIFYNTVILDLYNMIFESIGIIFIISFFFGINAGYQSFLQLSELGFADNGLSLLVILAFKQSGVMLSLFVLYAKYVSAIIAKVGFMKISEEWSALKIMKIEPKIFLLQTKIFALIVLVPFFAYFSIVISLSASFLVFHMYNGTNMQFFISTSITYNFKILLIPLIKGVVVGGLLGLIAAHEALMVEKSSENILKSLNRGLVISIIVCFIANVIMDLVFFH